MPNPPFTSLCISGLIRPIALSFCCRTEVLDFPNFQSPHIKVCTIGFLVRLSCTTTYMIYRSFPDISNNENGVQRDVVVQEKAKREEARRAYARYESGFSFVEGISYHSEKVKCQIRYGTLPLPLSLTINP